MFLSEFTGQLTYGEMAGLSIGGLKQGGVQPQDYNQIIINLNASLIELYTRLPLKTSQVNLQLYEHIALYTLHTDYASTNTASVQPYKYINDSTENPFTNDVLMVDSVFNEAGDQYPINEGKEKYSVFTPSYNTIQVPFSQDDNTLDIIYRAAPEKLSTDDVDPDSLWIPIPYQLTECLISYFMHKIYSSTGSIEDNQAGIFYNKYIRQLQTVKDVGLLIQETNLNERLDTGGWV